MNALPLSDSAFERAHTDLERLERTLAAAIVGQDAVIRDLVAGVLAGGHVLLEGLPGLGKTHLAKGLAGALGQGLARIQCTPDLMPSDITGSEVLVRDPAQGQQLEFRQGPIFAPMVLVDEINRATPRTQAALLEAMQEAQVTYLGRRYALPRPFWVLATQNPIELEGTYPLPEAQLDRFMMKLTVTYPGEQALLGLLEIALDDEPAEHVPEQLSPERVRELMALAREVVVAGPVRQAAVALVLATHPGDPAAGERARRHIHYGASPRGLQALVRAGRVRALQAGRAHLAVDDLAEVAFPVLRHRVLLRVESEMAGTEVDALLAELVQEWRGRW
jgi:MoxR-like ATPase